jgi:predicted acetyltransferase
MKMRERSRPGTNVTMPELSPPTSRLRESFVAAMAEFRAEGRGDPADHTAIGSDIREFWTSWTTAPDDFGSYVDQLRAQALEDSPRPAGYVPCTTLWWVEGDAFLGRVAVRHRLTPELNEFGGHIGYDVRPSARRRGHATAMLRAVLPVARGLGITSALVMCDAGNVASRRVIERNGGVFDSQCGDKLRFWVPTA